MNRMKFQKWCVALVAILILSVGIWFSFFEFFKSVRVNLSKQAQHYVTNITGQNSHAVKQQISGDFQTMGALSAAITSSDNMSQKDVFILLDSFHKTNSFKRMGIIDRAGIAVTTDNVSLDLSGRLFFKDALAGKTTISETLVDYADGELINVIAAPVYDAEGQISYVLFATRETTTYNAILSMEWLSPRSQTLVINSEGMRLLNSAGFDYFPDSTNILDTLTEKYLADSPDGFATIRADMKAGKNGIIRFKSNNYVGYAAYIALDMQDWYTFTVIPSDLVEEQTHVITSYGGELMVKIIAIIACFSSVLLILVYRNYKVSKRAHDELCIAEERYRIVTEQTNSIIYDYTITDGTIYHSPVFEQKFGYAPVTENFPQSAVDEHIVYPDDIPLFLETYRKCVDGKPYAEMEIRIRKSDDSYLWCLLRMTTVFDEQNKPFRIVGKITDIDHAKKRTVRLTELSERDSLTGFYNREVAHVLVTNYLNGSGSDSMSAMLLVDIDNFKQVNDRLGHQAGDHCLSEVTNKIKGLFGSSAILARIGGDEFVIFLKDIPNRLYAQKRGQQLCSSLTEIKLSKESQKHITISVGVAVLLAGENASYETLFRQADTAMYVSKRKGKNQCSLYEENYKEIMRNRDDVVLRNEDISNKLQAVIFSGDGFDETINELFRTVGEELELSRVYIMEKNKNDSYQNSFEWCAAGISSCKAGLQEITLGEGNNYLGAYNEEGFFYCANAEAFEGELYEALKRREVISMLNAAIWIKGEFAGCIGFEDCAASRLWSNGEIEVALYLAKLVGNLIIRDK